MYKLLRNGPLRWQLVLAGVEFAIIVASIRVAAALRFAWPSELPVAFDQPWHARALLVGCVLLVAIAALGLYELHLHGNWLGRLSRQAVAFMLGGVGLMVLYYAFPSAYIGRGVLGIGLFIGFIASLAWRVAFRSGMDLDLFKRRVVLLGAGEHAAEVARKMGSRSDQCGFTIVGYVPVGLDPVRVPPIMLLRPDVELRDWIQRLRVDEIVVGPDDRRGTLPVNDLLDCKQHGVAVTELAEFFERESGRIKLELTNPSWLVFADGFNISSTRRAIKRVFDLVAATTLLASMWPFMLLTALAIRLESGPGAPVLYRQERVGEYGRLFRVIKFRSMRTDAECDGVARWACRNDSRVTRVGRFIRKARLDEFPQLWNVVRGDMSIIGPRPERPQFVTDFNARIRFYSLRHSVKPGLSGWAQLRYPYGSSQEDAEEKLKFDLFYVKNQNFVFDLAILVQTVEVILFGRGAR